VIHVTQVEQLAKHYGLPIQPPNTPPVGQGHVFYREEYNPWLAGGLLLGILMSLYTFVRSEWGFRMLTPSQPPKSPTHPEPMV
jgi:hypothetical protein